MMKTFAIAGAIVAGLAVASGAFGAHALTERLDERMLAIWETAARYQMYHGLALFVAAWLAGQTGHSSAAVAGWSFIVGTLVFSGSLYLLALTGTRWLGAITPIGGVAFLVGWIACIVAALQLDP